jgi:hypothetical protein
MCAWTSSCTATNPDDVEGARVQSQDVDEKQSITYAGLGGGFFSSQGVAIEIAARSW